MPEWLDHKAFLYWMTITSVILAVVSLVLVPWIIVRLPADYFETLHRKGPLARIFDTDDSNKAVRIAYKVIKNSIAALILLAGVIMLFLPGQGILVIVFGLLLADLPGKQRLVRWLVCRKKVLGAMNWLRRRAHKPPLVMTHCDRQESHSVRRAA